MKFIQGIARGVGKFLNTKSHQDRERQAQEQVCTKLGVIFCSDDDQIFMVPNGKRFFIDGHVFKMIANRNGKKVTARHIQTGKRVVMHKNCLKRGY